MNTRSAGYWTTTASTALAFLTGGAAYLFRAEWAYAGIAFDLSGAVFSHAAIGHPAAMVIAPLAILGIAVASWALRPESQRPR